MDYMFVNKPEFAEAIRVLFLCGSKFKKEAESDKRTILKKHLEKNPVNKVILLEKYFNFALKKDTENSILSYYDAKLFNLYNIEMFAALVATNVIVFHETLSTAAEIGVFASNEILRKKIITIVPEKFSVEENKLSSFLSLAFWNSKEKLIDNNVIRFYPSVQKVIISEDRSFYDTYFWNNELPKTLAAKIDEQLNQPSICSISVIGEKINRLKNDILSVYMSYDSIKNYLLAIISIPENRRKIRECKKLFQIRNLLRFEFVNAVKNAYYNAHGHLPKAINIHIDNHPDYKFEDILNFMIYFWHACRIINIKCNEDKTISVGFCKNTSSFWKTYKSLINEVSFEGWGN